MTDAVGYAASQIGKTYKWATPLSWSDPNPSSFDCSGLVGWSYSHAGAQTLPHNSAAQYAEFAARGQLVPISQKQPNDVLFYDDGGYIHHCAIYAGNQTLIEAPETGIPVRYRSFADTDYGLMQHVGVYKGTGGTKAVTGTPGYPKGWVSPPIPPSSLHVPLTPAQRKTMLTYCLKVEGSFPDVAQAVYGAYDPSFTQAMLFTAVAQGSYDTQLLSLYTLNANGGLAHSPQKGDVTQTTIFTQIGNLIGDVTSASFWLRVGEVILGLLLLGVGVAKLTGASNAVSKVAGKVII